MGASVSKNVTKMVTNVVSTISNTTIQSTELTTDSQQIISVSDVGGDVWISGNVFYQFASVNMKALMNALSTESAQQQMVINISQQAKSLVSGLNLGQFSYASNDLDVLIQATINLVSTITQNCAARSEQNQSIVVRRVSGSVHVTNNVEQQMATIIGECVQDAVTNSQAVQDIQVQLSQSASATSKGLDPMVLAIMLAILIGFPTVGATVVGYSAVKFIFPIFIIVGVIFIILYYTWRTTEPRLTGFSSLISNTDVCVPVMSSTVIDAKTPAAASQACQADKQCVAFDWKGGDVDADGNYTTINPPQTTYYSQVTNECMKGLQQDKVNTIRIPKLLTGPDSPTGKASTGVLEGDIYINTKTSMWSQFTKDHWIDQKLIFDKDITKDHPIINLFLGDDSPKNDTSKYKDGDFYIQVNSKYPDSFTRFTFVSLAGQWIGPIGAPVPGPGPVAFTPQTTNTSGFKTEQGSLWMLYVGITGVIVGLLGTVITFYMASRKAKAEAAAGTGESVASTSSESSTASSESSAST